MSELLESIKQELQERISIFEKISPEEARMVKPIWNLLSCTHYYHCPDRKETPKGQRQVDCLYNPKMFRCPTYQHFESLCGSCLETGK